MAVGSCARMDLNALIAAAPPPIIKYCAKFGIVGVNSFLSRFLTESELCSSARKTKIVRHYFSSIKPINFRSCKSFTFSTNDLFESSTFSSES